MGLDEVSVSGGPERERKAINGMLLLGDFVREPYQLSEIAFFENSYWNALLNECLRLSVLRTLLVTGELLYV